MTTDPARSTLYPEFNSPEAVERGFLCCIFLDPHDQTGINDLTPDAFRDGRCRTVFRAIRALVDVGDVPSADAVHRYLEANAHLYQAGGMDYLMEICTQEVIPVLRSTYLVRLRHEAVRTALRTVGQLLLHETRPADAELEALASVAAAMIEEVRRLVPERALTKHRVWRAQTTPRRRGDAGGGRGSW